MKNWSTNVPHLPFLEHEIWSLANWDSRCSWKTTAELTKQKHKVEHNSERRDYLAVEYNPDNKIL